MERVSPRYTRRAIVRGGVVMSLTGLAVLAVPASSLSRKKDKDCKDFKTQKKAQKFFKKHQPGDPHGLDGDNDGIACETLP